uniref:carbamoyl-phosphate synthase arginine-specific small subunit n=1 Tax=Porphyridium aerugineum TaxID=2792 RepID=UPI001FCD5F0D|nr:carbamoyl-phosphate synthase arginine-specific small subunit [Porphyridium aerugineum]UNJ17995.1 carbamoyl-phosphate synthase arginine-specific small subunit [Porphyridium aerugineum]
MEQKKAILLLEDGSVYKGWSYSKYNTSFGEIVFNTGMTGYQEILTDPSYTGQIINFTYPEFGNTGINLEDNESNNPSVKGVIIRNITNQPSNWRSKESIINYLNRHNILSIHGIDTRKLAKHIRNSGAMNCIISNEELNIAQLMQQLNNVPKMEGLNLVDSVTTKVSYKWTNTNNPELVWKSWDKTFIEKQYYGKNLNIVIIDFGIKTNIIKCISQYNANIQVVPANSTIETILDSKPDGVLLSNGPGDPSTVNYIGKIIKELINKEIPIFGICMGHQVMGLSLGCNTFKLKFGHRGLNHPAGYYQKVNMTSQNHGFAVNNDSFIDNNLINNHFNLNDNTIAGISHKKYPIFSVQYHPEASPGPHDTEYLFESFIEIVRNDKIKKLKKRLNN